MSTTKKTREDEREKRPFATAAATKASHFKKQGNVDLS